MPLYGRAGVPLWSQTGGSDKAAMKNAGLRRNEPEERAGAGGVESRGPRSLTEACLRSVSGPLGRNNLNNAEIAAFSRHPSPQVWWGQTEIEPNNREWGVNPSHHCQRGPTWEWLYPSSPSHSTSLARNSVVCIWPGVCRFLLFFFFFFLSPPLPSPFPSIVPPEVFMGRPTGCSAHQEIKVSSSSQCAVARCDLFNSNRVNITDACKAGITVAELDVLRRDTGSVFFLLWLTHENLSPFFFFFPEW